MTSPGERAAALRNEHAPGVFPVPVEDIAKQLSIEILRKRHEGPESSFALRDGGKLFIGLNNNTSARRQRVAIAHALGHALMHDKPIIVCNGVRAAQNDLASRGTDEEEAQASIFAAELLMPPEAVLAVFTVRDGRSEAPFPRDEVVNDLAKKFEVGAEFMCWRLVSLGLLTN